MTSDPAAASPGRSANVLQDPFECPAREPLRLTSLPPEILSRIFMELSPLLLTEKARLCLLCKALLPLARGYLYKNNCFVPAFFNAFYAASESFQPFPTGKSSMNTTQRSVAFCKALFSGNFGEINLGKLSLECSQPESAPAWPQFQLASIHSIVKDRKIGIRRLSCFLPPLWIQAEFLDPFLRCDKPVTIDLQSSAIRRSPDANAISLTLRRSRKGQEGDGGAGKLYAAMKNSAYVGDHYDSPPNTVEPTVIVRCSPDIINTILDVYGSQLTDITLCQSTFKEHGSDVLWRSPNLRNLRIFLDLQHLDSSSTDKEDYGLCWAGSGITLLQVVLMSPIAPAAVLEFYLGVARKISQLKGILIVWRKSVKAVESSASEENAWEEVGEFCRNGTPQRREAVRHLKERQCALEVLIEYMQ